jgi:osmoprotectant transport system permease protein
MDVYSTDAKIVRYGLRVLEDDRHHFPDYDAVLVYRLEVPERFPETWAELARLEGRIDQPRMTAVNAEAELDGRPFADVARRFLGEGDPAPLRADSLLARLEGRIDQARMTAVNAEAELDGRPFADVARRFLGEGDPAPLRADSLLARLAGPDFWRLTGQHVVLVFGSLAAAIALGVPLGV